LGLTFIEQKIKNIEKYLRVVGNEMRCFKFGGSVIQAVHRDGKVLNAYADPRKGIF
jgi:hypothetical protein